MKQLLHSVENERTRRILGQFDDPLHAQELFALCGLQQVEEGGNRRIGDGAVMRQAEGSDTIVMGMVMLVMVVPMVVMVNSGSASAVASHVDEFELAGVTKAACIDAPCPRVAESPIHFECRYLSTHRLQGNSPEGTVDIVFARVERIHIKDDAIGADGKIDVKKLRPIARLGYYDYTVVNEIFEMKMPGASAAELAGLEGTPR